MESLTFLFTRLPSLFRRARGHCKFSERSVFLAVLPLSLKVIPLEKVSETCGKRSWEYEKMEYCWEINFIVIVANKNDRF